MKYRVELPDGRLLGLAESVGGLLSCGILVVRGVAVTDDSCGVSAALVEVGLQLSERYTGLAPSRIEGLAEARQLYKTFGMDPSRHRPSSEALLRRVLKGLDLYRINNVVDCCNLASLQFLLPIGLYDLDRIVGDVTLRTGSEGEEYPGIRKGPVHLADRLGLFDEKGPFGSPTSDSSRTCVSAESRNLLAVIMATAAYPVAAMEENLSILSGHLTAHCAGDEWLREVLGGGN